MSAKAESENTRLNFGNIPKGVFFEITGIQLIISTKFDKESYVATIGDVFSVFLPARYVNDRVMKFKVFFLHVMNTCTCTYMFCHSSFQIYTPHQNDYGGAIFKRATAPYLPRRKRKQSSQRRSNIQKKRSPSTQNMVVYQKYVYQIWNFVTMTKNCHY